MLCCIFRCRIPRTKQEIEADCARTRLTKQFRNHLEKLSPDDLELQKVLPSVQKLEEKRLKKGEKEERMSFFQKIKKIFAQEDDDTTETSSSIEDEDKSRDDDTEKRSKLSKENSKDSAAGADGELDNELPVHPKNTFETKLSIEITDDDEERRKKALAKTRIKSQASRDRRPPKKQSSNDEKKRTLLSMSQTSASSSVDSTTDALQSAPAILVPVHVESVEEE